MLVRSGALKVFDSAAVSPLIEAIAVVAWPADDGVGAEDAGSTSFLIIPVDMSLERSVLISIAGAGAEAGAGPCPMPGACDGCGMAPNKPLSILGIPPAGAASRSEIISRALDKREYLMIIGDNFSYFSIKLDVVTPHLNSLIEMIQMRGHNISF